MITTTYNPEADALYLLLLKGAEIAEATEVAQGILLDYDRSGRVLGIEVSGMRARSADASTVLAAE